MPLMPAFEHHPKEAAIIARILSGYGELEFMLAVCLGRIIRDQDVALKTYFRLKSESSRLDGLDPLLRAGFSAADLGGEYGCALGAMRYSLRIRNHFAHCHWGDTPTDLFFTNLQDAADAAESFEYKWRHVDEPRLKELEDWLFMTGQWWLFLGRGLINAKP
jgi:hypothetical protein